MNAAIRPQRPYFQKGIFSALLMKNSSKNTYQNLLRVVICGLRCSLYLRTVALLNRNFLPLATVLLGVFRDQQNIQALQAKYASHRIACLCQQAAKSMQILRKGL